MRVCVFCIIIQCFSHEKNWSSSQYHSKWSFFRQGKPERHQAPAGLISEFTWLLFVDPNWLVVDLPLWKILVNGKDYSIYYTLSHMRTMVHIHLHDWVMYMG